MKKLILNIILLIIPILLILIYYPVKKRYLFEGLKDDCFNHGIWIYDRIFENKKPVDIVFFGSSHTINAIDDKLIEEKLGNKNLNAVNLGYCRLGSNLYYVLLKEINKSKKLKTLIIEVREDEDRYSHPIFPYIAETRDVLLANLLFNRDYLDDCYKHLYYKLEIVRNFVIKKYENTTFRMDDFGFASHPDTASFEFLKEIKVKRNLSKPELKTFERNFHMKYPRTYFKKINIICKRNNIKLLFLYLPSYGHYIKRPKEFDTYKKYGEILIPPNEIFDNTSNWFDEDHLNLTGAKAISNWVGGEIK